MPKTRLFLSGHKCFHLSDLRKSTKYKIKKERQKTTHVKKSDKNVDFFLYTCVMPGQSPLSPHWLLTEVESARNHSSHRQEDRADWNRYVHRVIELFHGRHDEFGTFVFRSCLKKSKYKRFKNHHYLQGGQTLVVELSKYQSQTVRTWHALTDQNFSTLAKTTKSVMLKKISRLLCTWICSEEGWYLWYSVFAFRSSMSTFGRPDIRSSNSCSSNIETSFFGIMS